MITASATNPESLEDAHATIVELTTLVYRLQADNDHLKKLIFGRLRSGSQGTEDPDQSYLFGKPPEEAPKPEDEQTSSNSETEKKKTKKPTGRQPLPAGLPRVVEVIAVDEEERFCSCCDPAQERAVIGYEETEILEFVRAYVFVKVLKREKRSCPSGGDQVVTPSLPPRIIDKGRPGNSLLAFILVSKFVDHLPLHRICKILKRAGVRIPETTVCDWVGAVADALTPVLLSMKQALLQEPYLQADETPAKARAPGRKGQKLKQIYFFVYSAPGSDVIFDYRTSRAGSHAIEFLEGFEKGVLQVDEYSGYKQLFRQREGLERAGCWAHAFRKFEAALKSADRPTESQRVCRIVSRLSTLENLMRERHRSAEQRLAVRQRIHRGQLDRIKTQLDEALANPRVEPKSHYGQAVRYAHNHWESLTTFLRHGHVEMDNNAIERAIRPLAIGRKNWMHIGHIDAGDRAAVFYSIFSSCVRRDIDPIVYMTDILERLPTQPLEQVAALTPAHWVPASPAEINESASTVDPASAAGEAEPAATSSEVGPQALAAR